MQFIITINNMIISVAQNTLNSNSATTSNKMLRMLEPGNHFFSLIKTFISIKQLTLKAGEILLVFLNSQNKNKININTTI